MNEKNKTTSPLMRVWTLFFNFNIMNTEKCNFCNNLAKGVCVRCEELICDECNYSGWEDQENLCKNCKENKTERQKEENVYIWKNTEKTFLKIKGLKIKIIKKKLNEYEEKNMRFLLFYKQIANCYNLSICDCGLEKNDKRNKDFLIKNLEEVEEIIHYFIRYKIIIVEYISIKK